MLNQFASGQHAKFTQYVYQSTFGFNSITINRYDDKQRCLCVVTNYWEFPRNSSSVTSFYRGCPRTQTDSLPDVIPLFKA